MFHANLTVPLASLSISSPYDVDARYGRKRTMTWVGYKAHLTEACDDGRPRIITHVQTETAPTTDGAVTTPAHRALTAKGLLPAEHLVDSGYLDAALHAFLSCGQTRPPLVRGSWRPIWTYHHAPIGCRRLLRW